MLLKTFFQGLPCLTDVGKFLDPSLVPKVWTFPISPKIFWFILDLRSVWNCPLIMLVACVGHMIMIRTMMLMCKCNWLHVGWSVYSDNSFPRQWQSPSLYASWYGNLTRQIRLCYAQVSIILHLNRERWSESWHQQALTPSLSVPINKHHILRG